MSLKIKIDNNVQKTLGIKVQNNKIVRDESVLVPEVRKEFRKIGPKEIRKAILRDVGKGISPVEGANKFKKYSTSYKKEINKGTSNRMQAASPKKRRSPVTLRLTGQLWNSLKLYTTGGFRETFKLNFDWQDFLADIHNRQGAAGRVIRRILPTRSKEEFNEKINQTILDRLNRAAKAVAKRFS
jgi:hypothetical protein